MKTAAQHTTPSSPADVAGAPPLAPATAREPAMEFDELVERVKRRANLHSNGEAITAIRATLETLAERIEPEDAAVTGLQLPCEVQHCLLDAASATREDFSLPELYFRVARRANRDLRTATCHAQAVIGALLDADCLGRVRAQLPEDFQALFETAPRSCPTPADHGTAAPATPP